MLQVFNKNEVESASRLFVMSPRVLASNRGRGASEYETFATALFEILRLFKVHPAVSLKKLRFYEQQRHCDSVWKVGEKSMFKGNEISKMLVNNDMLEIRAMLC